MPRNPSTTSALHLCHRTRICLQPWRSPWHVARSRSHMCYQCSSRHPSFPTLSWYEHVVKSNTAAPSSLTCFITLYRTLRGAACVHRNARYAGIHLLALVRVSGTRLHRGACAWCWLPPTRRVRWVVSVSQHPFLLLLLLQAVAHGAASWLGASSTLLPLLLLYNLSRRLQGYRPPMALLTVLPVRLCTHAA